MPTTEPQLQKNDQPLGDLDVSKYTYRNFIYPTDLGTPNGVTTAGKDHYMVFHINESSNTQFKTDMVNGVAPGNTSAKDAKGNFIKDQKNQPTITSNTNTDKGFNPDGSPKNQPNANGTTPQGTDGNVANQDITSQSLRSIQRVATTIVLYMPQDIQTNYAAAWGETDFGVAKEVMQDQSLRDLFSSGVASGMKNAAEMGNNFTGLNLKDALSLGYRMVINNHQEVIFNGITFRTFNFNFRFTPESEDESINVDNIIRAFKFYSAPEIKNGMTGRFWIYPAEFDIQYYANGVENQFLNKISTCALTNMTVNYTPTGHWAAFRAHSRLTGAPSVCTDITLQFTELELMTKQRVLEGY